MSFGGEYGGALQTLGVPYLWIFLINAILLLILFVLSAIFYPYDAPQKDLQAEVNKAAGKGKGKVIGMTDLVKRMN